MTDTLQIITSVVGVGITVMLALVAGVWHLRGRLDQMETRFQQVENRMETRFERIETRLENFGVGIRSPNRQLASAVGILPSAFAFLPRSKAITDRSTKNQWGNTNRVAQGAESLIDHLTRSMNPLTPDEGQRFKALVNKARLGEFFSYEEVVEYNKLINKVQTEHPDDPRIWPLVALGVFLSGLYVGKRQDDMQYAINPATMYCSIVMEGEQITCQAKFIW